MELHHNWRTGVNHDLYLQIAIDRFYDAEKAYLDFYRQIQSDGEKQYFDPSAPIRQNCIETVCFSAMAAESFINTFSAVYISESFAKTIDHLDACAKWTVVMKAYKGIELLYGEAPLQRLSQTIKKRNSFVHSKSRKLLEQNDSFVFPELDIIEDYLNPAHDSLLAIKDCHDWISNHCDSSTLNFDIQAINLEEIAKYKSTEKFYHFMEPIMII